MRAVPLALVSGLVVDVAAGAVRLLPLVTDGALRAVLDPLGPLGTLSPLSPLGTLDAVRGGQPPLGRRGAVVAAVVAGEPAGLVVDGGDRHRGPGEVPGGDAVPATGGERQLHGPLAVLGAPGIPLDALGRHSA